MSSASPVPSSTVNYTVPDTVKSEIKKDMRLFKIQSVASGLLMGCGISILVVGGIAGLALGAHYFLGGDKLKGAVYAVLIAVGGAVFGLGIFMMAKNWRRSTHQKYKYINGNNHLSKLFEKSMYDIATNIHLKMPILSPALNSRMVAWGYFRYVDQVQMNALLEASAEFQSRMNWDHWEAIKKEALPRIQAIEACVRQLWG